MMGTFAEELYSETLKLVDVKLDSSSTLSIEGAHTNVDGGDGSTRDDDDFWDASDEVVETSDLDREWEKRREGFQTIGYRDGIIAGKEASAQEGFNLGFKESVNAGYRWGLVRGITSIICKTYFKCPSFASRWGERVMETDTRRIQLQRLFDSTSSVSTTDALKSFHDDIILNKKEDGSITTSSPTSECLIDKYYREITLFVKESPAINIQPMIDPYSRGVELESCQSIDS